MNRIVLLRLHPHTPNLAIRHAFDAQSVNVRTALISASFRCLAPSARLLVGAQANRPHRPHAAAGY
jgi:hypothetical protein